MVDERLTITLKTPVIDGGTTITELKFREPKARDLRTMPAEGSLITMGHFLDLAGKLTGQLPQVIDALCAEDAGVVLRLVNSFLLGGEVPSTQSEPSR